jgi:undecaprenyl diphosphate synthase
MALDTTNIPKHIAIIMDGNRRWAKQRGLPAVAGHGYVVDKVLEELIERCGELGVEHLTLWAFSTENWKRDATEVEGVMNLFRMAIAKKAKRFVEKGAKLSIIGDLSRFPEDIQRGMKKLVETSSTNYKVKVNLAINYGGRDEIVRAVKRLIDENIMPGLISHDYTREQPLNTKERPLVTEELLGKYLDTAGIPDPDLIIRTGGEQRLSGFLPWQAVYSELYFTKILMPDFGSEQLGLAIEEYQGRQRRFGR